jgi:nucleotide-binding universal stress UspA family protein
MNATVRDKMRYLELDRLTTNPALAQRLPPELAFQYHALPVAEREGCLTIAMANPEDGAARAAVCGALGTTPYLVKGDAKAIDMLLAEMWPEQSPKALHFLVLDQPSEKKHAADAELWAYASALSERLGASLEREYSDSILGLHRSDYDLIIMNKAERPAFWQVMAGLKAAQSVNQPPTSLLIVREPVWPLTNLLMVIRCNETSDAALSWIIKMAKPAELAVTLLLVTPFLPIIHYDSYVRSLMSPGTEVGNWLERASQQFEQCQILSAVKIRQGEPVWQLKQELAEGRYDLAVIAYKQAPILKQWLFKEELVCSLLDDASCPVLIAQ